MCHTHWQKTFINQHLFHRLGLNLFSDSIKKFIDVPKGSIWWSLVKDYNCRLNEALGRSSGRIVLWRKVFRRETPVPSMSRPIFKLLGNVTRTGELWEYSNQAGRGWWKDRRRWGGGGGGGGEEETEEEEEADDYPRLRCDYPHGWGSSGKRRGFIENN